MTDLDAIMVRGWREPGAVRSSPAAAAASTGSPCRQKHSVNTQFVTDHMHMRLRHVLLVRMFHLPVNADDFYTSYEALACRKQHVICQASTLQLVIGQVVSG